MGNVCTASRRRATQCKPASDDEDEDDAEDDDGRGHKHRRTPRKHAVAFQPGTKNHDGQRGRGKSQRGTRQRGRGKGQRGKGRSTHQTTRPHTIINYQAINKMSLPKAHKMLSKHKKPQQVFTVEYPGIGFPGDVYTEPKLIELIPKLSKDQRISAKFSVRKAMNTMGKGRGKLLKESFAQKRQDRVQRGTTVTKPKVGCNK